jgi:hypothetical protein
MAVGNEYLIGLKVRVADVLHCSPSVWDEGFGHLIARHHLDFVLCDPHSTEVVVAIELDDRSHDQPQRQRRDSFLNDAFKAARLRLVRVKAAARYRTRELRQQLWTRSSLVHE